jgi:hypothetical protein
LFVIAASKESIVIEGGAASASCAGSCIDALAAQPKPTKTQETKSKTVDAAKASNI